MVIKMLHILKTSDVRTFSEPLSLKFSALISVGIINKYHRVVIGINMLHFPFFDLSTLGRQYKSNNKRT